MQRTRTEQHSAGRIDWARELNPQQLAAVTAPDGPVLVLAGAGSGKTRVITYRVAYLISERRVRPQNILLATFTNKAARSMLSRAEEVAGLAARDVAGGTFHHIANLQLRRYARAAGLRRQLHDPRRVRRAVGDEALPQRRAGSTPPSAPSPARGCCMAWPAR